METVVDTFPVGHLAWKDTQSMPDSGSLAFTVNGPSRARPVAACTAPTSSAWSARYTHLPPAPATSRSARSGRRP